MHRVLGTNECVANYLDGGFMRSAWCLSHTSSLFLLFVALFFLTKPIWLLWPGESPTCLIVLVTHLVLCLLKSVYLEQRRSFNRGAHWFNIRTASIRFYIGAVRYIQI